MDFRTMCTEFGADSSSRFSFTVRTHADTVIDATIAGHATATGGVGNYLARSAKVAERAICFTDRNFYLFFFF